ncbi:MAG TPA: ATP-grasp domain-containing protein [Burkholderiaceae bacterium]|nr:ATP-grasp domain-containing protein [Burkholderiaceae bacterium]
MDFVEYQGKAILAEAGLPVPEGRHCTTPDEAANAVAALGPCAVKAQVPAGKRGKAGGVRLVENAQEARVAASDILKLTIGGHAVGSLLVERRVPVAGEFYAAVMNDVAACGPLVLFSLEGGMDIEEIAQDRPEAVCRIPVDIERGLSSRGVADALSGCDLDNRTKQAVAAFLVRLYETYIQVDAELLEINPLARLEDGSLLALDCKLAVDDSAAYRQEAIVRRRAPEHQTELEARGAEAGLKFIELEGNVGVLANGAGLTMTTMDVIDHFGAHPSNFLEIGGDAYTKAEPALKLVLANPNVKSLIVNFCGAFARTDVMTEGVVKAWEALKPQVPVFFSIHGTGEDEAVRILRSRLGIEAYDRMEDAIVAAVEATGSLEVAK